MAASSPKTDPYAGIGIPDTPADSYANIDVAEADPYTGIGTAEPQSSAVGDMAKRAVRGAIRGTSRVADAFVNLIEPPDPYEGVPEWHVRNPRPDPALYPEEAKIWDKIRKTSPIRQPDLFKEALTEPGKAWRRGAEAIEVDSARDEELKSSLAEGIGAGAPALAAAFVNPVLAVPVLAGQMGEEQRAVALAEGDSPELANEKAKLGRLGGALFAALPVGPVRGGAGIVERLATRSATGGVVNAAQDAALQAAVEQKVDWGRVKKAGAIGTGLGLVLGVPEAIALRRSLKTTVPLEGRTLGDAVQAIAEEQQRPTADVAAQINEMAGVTKPAPRNPGQTDSASPAPAAATEPTSLFAARNEANRTPLKPDYQYTVYKAEPHPVTGETIPGYVQIDEIVDGVNTRSSSLEALRKEGLELPDVPEDLPSGRYTPEQIRAAAVPRDPAVTESVASAPAGDSATPAPVAAATSGSALEGTVTGTGPGGGQAGENLAATVPEGKPRGTTRREVQQQTRFVRDLEQQVGRATETNPRKAQKLSARLEQERAKLRQMELDRNTGRPLRVGLAPDGTADLLTAIEDLGGVGGPSRGLERTPEYDGFNEAFASGPARLLRRKGGGGIDTFISQLEAHGFKFDSMGDFYSAVGKASAQRVKLAKQLGDLEYGSKFDAALMDNVGRKPHLDPVEPIRVDELNVGDEFKVRGERVKVTDIDPDTNAVKIEDGVKRELPAGAEIYPDNRSLKRSAGDSDFAPNRQGGFIDPQLLLPIARSAVGGALGYASGDTPEERVRNGLLGMGFGLLASPARARQLARQVLNSPVGAAATAKAKTATVRLQKLVAPQSFLPPELRQQVRWGEQSANAITQAGLSLTRDLEKAISGVGDLAARGAAAEATHRYLTGTATLAALPRPVQVAAQKVRLFVDALSDRAVAEGVVTGPMAQTFLDNRGTYLRRSYEIFLNPEFKPEPAKIRAAIDAVATANGSTRAEAESIVAGILDRNQRASLGDYLVGRGKIAGKDVSSLIKRKDLLPEIRAVLGEVNDPILTANQTIPRLARLIENDAAQRQMRAIGQRLGVFSETQSLTHPSPLVAETSQTHGGLTGLFAAPEVADALRRVGGSGRLAFVPEVLWKTLTTASGAAKAAKTVGNPESYAPNFIGGLISTVANGNFRLDRLGRGLVLGAEELGALRAFSPQAPKRDALRQELFTLRKLGLLGESTAGEDLLRTIEGSYWGALGDKAKAAWRIPAKTYGSIDDLTRYVAYRSELARYTAAFPMRPASELQRLAAEVTRATMPTYSEIPHFVKQLSTAGFAPPFVNFTWEVFRNTLNSARIGARDLQQGTATGNAALRNAGAVRLASLTAALGLASAYGVSKLSRDENGVTDEQDAAVRFFSPPWNRDGTLQYHTPAAAGRPVSFSNLSYILPHAVAWQALDAGRRGLEEQQAAPEFLRALGEQFGANPVKDSVILSPLVGALTGTNPQTGATIPRTAVEATAVDRAKYFVSAAFKPLVVDWVDKMRKAKGGEQGDFGRVYSTEEQWRRLAGIRQQTLDPSKAVPWKARRLGGQFNDAGDLYQLQVKRNPEPEKLNEMYGRSENERRRIFGEMQAMLRHARSLGVKDDDTIASMRAARIPAETILGVLENRYTPLERDKPKTAGQFFAELQAKRGEERRAALAQIYRDDPRMAKQVIRQFQEAAKGRTERDKLVLSLGVEDGARARYLRGRLETIQGPEARRAWLLDLHRKGILTETVFAQMAANKGK